MRPLLATFAVLCLGGVAYLVTSPPARKPAPKPIVRVVVEHFAVVQVVALTALLFVVRVVVPRIPRRADA